MVLHQLMGVLANAGISRIETEGEVFNPHCHECAAVVPSDVCPEDGIVQEIRSGYRLNGKVLRAPRVIVSSGPAEVPAMEDV
jgi:molecular chaperone GrpE